MEDFEKLLDAIFPFVEDLLVKYGEFYPLASAIDNQGEIISIGSYDGDDHPESDKVIADLKIGLREGVQKGEYRAISLFYDVRVTDDTGEKTDAIAVLVENKEEPSAYILYYPYQLTEDKELVFSESWRSETDKEIFI